MPTTPSSLAVSKRCPIVALLAALLCVPLAAQGQVQSQSPGQSRGELLYRTHCAECHSSKMHWREKKLVNDWPSLLAQVRFWQTQASLSWTDDDVTQVAAYLNATYYRLPPQAERKVASR
jgi:mono/diheme cytochrome c family protein